jgi:hypothetical protein
MSRVEFDTFHTEVLNLPRESFNFDIYKIKSLSEYLFVVKNSFPSDGLKLSDIYFEIHNYLKKNNINLPNDKFESLFNLDLNETSSIKQNYKREGRTFRHWMGLAKLFSLLKNNEKKSAFSDFAKEIYLMSNDDLKIHLREQILSINTIDNPHLKSLDSSYLYENLDYRPAIAILSYLNILGRKCTQFELAVFFGRPDHSLNSEGEIIRAAVKIGRKFPITQAEQEQYYFVDLCGWGDEDGNHYEYNSSQQSYFKFKTFFLIMESVGLIQINNNQISLTDYSRDIFEKQNIEDTLLDDLYNELDTFDSDEKVVNEVINNHPNILSRLIHDDPKFIEKANLKASQKSSSLQSQSSDGIKFKRNKLIVEISKIQASYICQGCNFFAFKDKHNNNYVETHHIIEYNKTEQGPDVLQNLLVLCPNCHSKIHFSNLDTVHSFFNQLREKKSITLDQFKEIHTNFNMLKLSHIKILCNKNIISKNEEIELIKFIND